jgi:hypothetical protein
VLISSREKVSDEKEKNREKYLVDTVPLNKEENGTSLYK